MPFASVVLQNYLEPVLGQEFSLLHLAVSFQSTIIFIIIIKKNKRGDMKLHGNSKSTYYKNATICYKWSSNKLNIMFFALLFSTKCILWITRSVGSVKLKVTCSKFS